MPLIHEYFTKGGVAIDSPADRFGTIQDAAAVAAKLLEMDDKTVLQIATLTGGIAAVRVEQIDHIATEMIDEPK